LFAFALLWAHGAVAGSITAPFPNPNPFTVTCTDEHGIERTLGSLEIDIYEPRVFLDSGGDVRGGAGMEATFSGTQDPDCYIEFDFVQAIVGGNSTIGDPPYLDPFVADDAYPFYWTATEYADNFTINFLQSFTWGYSFSYNAVTSTYTSTLDQMQWTDPSQTIMNLVDDWPTYAPLGDGSWNVTEDECCGCNYPIPEPTTVSLLLLGIVLTGARRYSPLGH
jgi:hypothetical protein